MSKKRKSYTDSQLAKLVETRPDGFTDIFMRPRVIAGVPVVEIALPDPVLKEIGGKLIPTVTIPIDILADFILNLAACAKRAAEHAT